MLRTRGVGVQDNWDLWINATCGLGVSYTLFGEENDVSMDGRKAGRETACLQKHERCARRKSTAECPDVLTIDPEYPSWLSSLVFRFKNDPWN